MDRVVLRANCSHSASVCKASRPGSYSASQNLRRGLGDAATVLGGFFGRMQVVRLGEVVGVDDGIAGWNRSFGVDAATGERVLDNGDAGEEAVGVVGNGGDAAGASVAVGEDDFELGNEKIS